MVRHETRVTLLAVGLAIAAWYVSLGYTDDAVVHGAILLGVGVVAPMLYLEVRGAGARE